MTLIIDALVILFALGIFALLCAFCKRYFKDWHTKISINWCWHHWLIGIGVCFPWGELGFGGSINLGPLSLVINIKRKR